MGGLILNEAGDVNLINFFVGRMETNRPSPLLSEWKRLKWENSLIRRGHP